MTLERKIVGSLEVNRYILALPEGRVEIDPGDGAPEAEKIDYVLLTHGHFDHILGVARQKEQGSKVLISEADAGMFESSRTSLCPPDAVLTPVKPDGFLEAGTLRLCGAEFQVIPTPGHTPGSVSLYLPSESMLFSGDTLFKHGYGRTDFPGGSMMQLIASLRRLFELPDELIVYPGHGESGRLIDIKKGYLR